MYAAVQIFDRINKGIKKERGATGGRVHPRNTERCMIYARLFTIINALEHTFFLEDSPSSTEDVILEDFLETAPYLTCTEEIALFTFTMLQEQFFESYDFFEHIKTVWEETGQFKSNRKDRTPLGGQQDMYDYDYSYIKIPMPRKQLAIRINLLMPEETGKCSVVDIDVALTNMASQSFTGKRWSEHAQDGEVSTLPKTILTQRTCCILRSLLDSTADDGKWTRVMDYARNRYTEPQTIITAIPDDTPYTLKTIRWLPKESVRPLQVDNYLYVAPEEERMLGFRTQTERTTTIKRSFESIAFMKAKQPRIKRARVQTEDMRS